LIDGHSNIDHADSNTVDEATDEQHSDVNRGGLKHGGEDTDDAGDLDGKASAATIQQPGNDYASNDTTTCEKSIVGW